MTQDFSLKKKLGLLFVVVAVLAVVGRIFGIVLPTIQWFFSFQPARDSAAKSGWESMQADVIGGVLCFLCFSLGMWFLLSQKPFQWNPMTIRRFQRFRAIRRGWWSFLILLGLLFLAMCDQALVGKRPLVMSYKGQLHFPAFRAEVYPAQAFGGAGEEEADFRALKSRFQREGKGDWVVMPLIPYDQTFDADDLQSVDLVQRDGRWYRDGDREAYSGRAFRYYSDDVADPPEKVHSEYRMRRGLIDGDVAGFGPDGAIIFTETWLEGKVLSRKVIDEVATNAWKEDQGGVMTVKLYPPVGPSWKDSHFLGTSSNGWDLAAQIYGGLQVVLKASLVYLALTYFFGIVIGCAMGYWGGFFDIIVQRLIEILSSIPFLLTVMIIVNGLGRENAGLFAIVGIICFFSWIGVAVYMRTAAYREKARDYVAAARLIGATTPRIIFRHLVPNALSTIVTLIPFSVISISTSITALDFIGFGLPDQYPSWGRVLEDGLNNLDAPWIVASTATAMFVVLLLFSFVGEAIREAFDPKKFTIYQ